MIAILIILAIIASAASYLLGAVMAAGARADLEHQNKILRDAIIQTLLDATDSFQETNTASRYISHDTYQKLLKINKTIIQNTAN